MDPPLQIEVDGHAATAEALWAGAFAFGHFTAMQVRDRRTRGIDRHLARLAAATEELFGDRLDGEGVRAHIRHALAGTSDASIRVYVFRSAQDLHVIVTVRAPGGIATVPQRLEVVDYQRPRAHLKHVGFVHVDYTVRAQERGFDGALLTGDGEISEAAIANIGFFQGSTVVWPSAPHLPGITMQLLEDAFAERGMSSRQDPVRLADVSRFEGAFLPNARGIVPVGSIGDIQLPLHRQHMHEVHDAYGSVPWVEI